MDAHRISEEIKRSKPQCKWFIYKDCLQIEFIQGHADYTITYIAKLLSKHVCFTLFSLTFYSNKL